MKIVLLMLKRHTNGFILRFRLDILLVKAAKI